MRPDIADAIVEVNILTGRFRRSIWAEGCNVDFFRHHVSGEVVACCSRDSIEYGDCSWVHSSFP